MGEGSDPRTGPTWVVLRVCLSKLRCFVCFALMPSLVVSWDQVVPEVLTTSSHLGSSEGAGSKGHSSLTGS